MSLNLILIGLCVECTALVKTHSKLGGNLRSKSVNLILKIKGNGLMMSAECSKVN